MKLINLKKYSALVLVVMTAVVCGGCGKYASKQSLYMKDSRKISGASGAGNWKKRSLGRMKRDDRRSKKSRRMIVYRASYRLGVQSVPQTLNAVRVLARQYKGFLEEVRTSGTYRSARIVLRVPAARFYDVLKKIEKLGSVRHKEIFASDITMQYHDMGLRIKTARLVRKRLYELLGRIKKVKQRIKILKEIERLTTVIDSLTSRRQFLKNRAAYSTIVLRLRAVMRHAVTRYIPSPFPWIRALAPTRRSIYDSEGDVSYRKPKGFFYLKNKFYDRRASFLFTTPGNAAALRVGLVRNEPLADLKFWKEALRIDLKNRKYRVSRSDIITSGKRRYFMVEILWQGKVYILAITVKGDEIAVIEALCSSEKNYRRYKKRIDTFIRSVRIK